MIKLTHEAWKRIALEIIAANPSFRLGPSPDAPYICRSCGRAFGNNDASVRRKAANGEGTYSARYFAEKDARRIESGKFCSSICYSWGARKKKWRQYAPNLSDEEIFAIYREYQEQRQSMYKARWLVHLLQSSLKETPMNVS